MSFPLRCGKLCAVGLIFLNVSFRYAFFHIIINVLCVRTLLFVLCCKTFFFLGSLKYIFGFDLYTFV